MLFIISRIGSVQMQKGEKMQLSKEGTTFISIETVLEEMETWVCCSEDERKMLEITKKWLKGYPAADVRENVRGEWIEVTDENFASTYYCSNCHNAPIVNLYGEYDFSIYCPKCGADMRGSK